MDAQKIGKLINELRTKKNLTQKDLADLVNVTDKAVSKWERGDGCPDVSIMPNLAKELGVSVEDLMSGENPNEKTCPQKKIIDYNFARPSKLNKWQMYELWTVGEKFADVISEKIFSMSGEKFQINIASVDELSNMDFARSVPSRTFIYNFDYNNGGFCLELNPVIGKALLKQNLSRYQEVTTLDTKMLGEFFAPEISSTLLEIFYDRTNKSIPFAEFELKRPEIIMNPMLIPYQNKNNISFLMTFHVTADDAEGNVNVQLSDGFIERLTELNFFATKGTEPVFQQLQNIKENSNVLNTFVEFGRFSPENVPLEKGKILIFDKKKTEGLNVVFQNKIIHTGSAVVIDENFGVRILEDKLENEILYDEKEYLSVQLGGSFFSEDEAASLKQGSILELNTMAKSPLAIVNSGRTVAEGEIVIVGENFGIRIMRVA